MNKQLIKKISSLLLSLPIVFTLSQNVNAMLSQNVNDMNDNWSKIWESIVNDDSSHIENAQKIMCHMKENGYKITNKLGHGYNGIVYLAKSPSNNNVALKFTYHDAHDIRGTIKRFLGDIYLYKKLAETKKDLGSGLCKIFGCESINVSNPNDYDVCVVLEYLEGKELHNYINNSKFTYDELLEWLKNICGSLNEMHKLGYVHRDISEYNIIIKKDGSAVLTDFGKTLNYGEHDECSGFSKRLFEFCEDLSGITKLIKFLVKHQNYEKSDNDEKLLSLCESKTFDEFYKNLREM